MRERMMTLPQELEGSVAREGRAIKNEWESRESRKTRR